VTMILDVAGALAELLEPDPVPPAAAPRRVVLDVEPLTWESGSLYVYPEFVDEIPFETGGSRRQEFELRATLIVSNEGEEALQARKVALAAELDEIRGRYLSTVRNNQTTALWGMIRARVDTTSPRMLDKRSASIRVSGWRIIGG
jgi:hypothetical protein